MSYPNAGGGIGQSPGHAPATGGAPLQPQGHASKIMAAGGGMTGGPTGTGQGLRYYPYQPPMQPGLGMPGAYPGYHPNAVQYQQVQQMQQYAQMQQFQYMQKMHQMELMRRQQLAQQQQQQQQGSPSQQAEMHRLQQLLLQKKEEQDKEQELRKAIFGPESHSKKRAAVAKEGEAADDVKVESPRLPSTVKGASNIQEEEEDEEEGDEEDEEDEQDEQDEQEDQRKKQEQIDAMKAKLAALEQQSKDEDKGKGKDKGKGQKEDKGKDKRGRRRSSATTLSKENLHPQVKKTEGSPDSSSTASYSGKKASRRSRHRTLLSFVSDGIRDAIGLEHLGHSDDESSEATAVGRPDSRGDEEEVVEAAEQVAKVVIADDSDVLKSFEVRAVVDQRAQPAHLIVDLVPDPSSPEPGNEAGHPILMKSGTATVSSVFDANVVFARFELEDGGFNVTVIGRKLALVQMGKEKERENTQSAILLLCKSDEEAARVAETLTQSLTSSQPRLKPVKPGKGEAPSNRGPRATRAAARSDKAGVLSVRRATAGGEEGDDSASNATNESELDPREVKRQQMENFRRKDAEIVKKRNAIRDKEKIKKEEEERKKAEQRARFRKQRDAIVRRARLKHVHEREGPLDGSTTGGNAPSLLGGAGSVKSRSKYSETPSTHSSAFGNSASTTSGGAGARESRTFSPLRTQASISEMSAVTSDYNYGRSMRPLVPKDSPDTRQRMEMRRRGRDARKQEVRFMKDIEVIRNVTNRRRIAQAQKAEVDRARMKEKEEKMQRLIEKEDAVEAEIKRRSHNRFVYEKKKRQGELEEEHLQRQYSNLGSSTSLSSNRWSSRRLLNNKSRASMAMMSRRSLSPVAGEDGFDSTGDEASPDDKHRGRTGKRASRKGRLDTGSYVGGKSVVTAGASALSPAERARRQAERDRSRRLAQNSKVGRKAMMKQGMFGVLTYSALDIQRMWRAFLARRRVQDIRYQVAVVTIQYWIRDILHNRTLVALQKLSMRKHLAREVIGFWLLRRYVLPRRYHRKRKEHEHREHKKREMEERRELESRKRAETERAVAAARKKREEEERNAQEAAAAAAAAGEEGTTQVVPNQDTSEACSVM